jgi:cobyrinic acid a,c-diamide synthase
VGGERGGSGFVSVFALEIIKMKSMKDIAKKGWGGGFPEHHSRSLQRARRQDYHRLTNIKGGRPVSE